MPKMQITKRKFIDAPVDKVYNVLNSMDAWQEWSPWLIMEPDAKVDVASDNKSYSWNGDRVGEGHMEIISEDEGKSIDYDLTFLKPWKSTAKVKFETIAKDGGTEVAWHMDSSLPWFMFWMKKMMTAFVGQDYERGLNLLKDYAEDGKVHSKLNWHGIKEYPGCTFVGMRRTCSIADMPDVMKKDFETLIQFTANIDGANMEQGFSQYHKFDFVKQIASFTSGIPIPADPGSLPKDAFVGSLPETNVYRLEHVGPYEHLGNAWNTVYTMHRNKEFKPNKSIHPFETYGNSPTNTDPHDLITYINFPTK